MDCNKRTFEELHPPSAKQIALKERATICGNRRTFEELPLIKIAMHEWAAMHYNEGNLEELPMTKMSI